jgi:hypothetical protein
VVDDLSELPQRLRALGRAVSARLPDDLADRVLADLAAVPPKRGVPWRRWIAAFASLIVALGVSLAISAPVRAAFLSVLGFGAVQVREEPGPAPAATPVLPGEHRADIETAQREVGFRVRVPAALGPPDSVTVADGRVVSLHYLRGSSPIRIDEFAGDLGPMWSKFAQSVADGTTVNGHAALWFDGPVTLVYVDATGVERTESARQTDRTLVWVDGGLMFRLDGIGTLDAALAVARSMT